MIATWSVAARFTTIGEAAAARSALDVAGIETYLADERVAEDALSIMVHEEDVERARSIIRASRLADGATETEALLCPDCGSRDVHPIPRLRIFLLLGALFVGAGAAVGQIAFATIGLVAVAAGIALMDTHRCRNCHETSTPVAGRRVPPLPGRYDLVERPCPRCGAVNLFALHRCPSCGFVVR